MKSAINCISSLLIASSVLFAQGPGTTQIVGPIYTVTGNLYTGYFIVQSQAKTNTGWVITGTGQGQTVTVTAGVINGLYLVPNDTSVPNLTSYLVTFANNDSWTCIVQTSVTPLPFTQECSPNSPQPNVGQSISPSQIIPSLVNGNVLEVVNGITSWSSLFTSTTANYTQPAVSSTVTVSVGNTGWMVVGQVIFIGTGGYYSIFSIPGATSVVLTNLGYTGNASPTTVITAPQKVSIGGISPSTNGILGQVLTSNGTGGFSTPFNVTQSGAASSLVETDSGGNVWSGVGFISGASANGFSFIPRPTFPYEVAFIPTVPNIGGQFHMHPSGSSTSSAFSLVNSSDTTLANAGELRLQVFGAAATIQTRAFGTGTPFTTLAVGEDSSSSSLSAINFTFNGVTKEFMTPTAFSAPSLTSTGAAQAVSTGQISYGGTTVVASNCGSLSGAAGCIVVNVAGTTHYVPYW